MADNKVQAKLKKLPPIENPELKKAIADLKEGSTPEKQKALMVNVGKAQLLSPCDFAMDIQPDENGEVKNIHPNQIKFYLINTKDGKTFFPVFTDIQEARKMNLKPDGKEPKYVVRKIADFDKLLIDPNNKANGVVINPGSDNIVFPKQLIGVLSGRVKPQVTPQKTVVGGSPINVVYSEPAVYPTKMVNDIHDYCITEPSISRVWLKQKTAAGQISFLLAVEMEKQDQAILNKLIEVSIPNAKDIPVETVFYNDQVEKTIIKGAYALYDKEIDL